MTESVPDLVARLRALDDSAGTDGPYTGGARLEREALAVRSRSFPALLDLVEAAWRLSREGALSTSSGGDPGMIFDADDAWVERNRRGTQTVDLACWKAFTAGLTKAVTALAGEAPAP